MHGDGLREIAFAKINLALHVRERLTNGYHRIETIFAFADDGDRLSAEPSDALSLTVSGPFGSGLSAGLDNLVIRAAKAMQAAFDVKTGAALHLDKALPVASGIGGGSADAAATLRLLTRLWDVQDGDRRMSSLAADLGADVPACLGSKTCFGDGVGANLAPLEDPEFRGMPLLLVNPGIALETAPVFTGWDGNDQGALSVGSLSKLDDAWRNDLTGPACGLVPAIGDVLAVLADLSGAEFVRMSGSGATCFALFSAVEPRDRAARHIAAARPRWWVMSSRLR